MRKTFRGQRLYQREAPGSIGWTGAPVGYKKPKKHEKHINVFQDKKWLKSRGVIESVIDLLKHICDIEHSRHRGPVNAMGNILAGLAAYSFLDHKPSVKNKNIRFREYLSLNNLPLVA
ncbi:MAG: transposase [Prolixibacteraceae bacterium]|nr:transposase [Prolixibacteraceae bacterium]